MTKPPKRPRDFSQAAKLVIDVASGQVEDAGAEGPADILSLLATFEVEPQQQATGCLSAP